MINKIYGLLIKFYERITGEKLTSNVNTFLKNLKYAIFGYGIAAFCVFAFEILAGRILGAESYGKYALVSVVSLFLSLLMTAGITTATTKYIAEEENHLTRQKIISSSYLMIFFLIFAAGFVLFIFSSQISKIFSIPLNIFYTAIFLSGCFSLYTLATDILRGLHQIKKLSAFRIIYGLFIVSFLIIFLLFSNVYFKTAAFIISFTYILIFLLVTINIRHYLSFKIDKVWIKELFNYGKYVAVGGLLFIFLPRLGQIYVNKYLAVSNVGIYNAYYFSSISIISFFYTTFVTVFFPTASKYQEKEPILRKIKKFIPLLFLAGIPLLFFTQWIILKFYGSEYPIDYFLMILFAISSILILIYGLYGWLFYSKSISGAKLITALTIIITVVNILLNIYLIPLFFLRGAALAIVLTYFLGTICLFLLQKNLFYNKPTKYDYKKIKICYVASADITLKFILFNHLKFLKNNGYDVYAICSPGKWVQDIEKAGIKVKPIKFKRKISPFSDIISFCKIFFYFRKEKFYIIHTHTTKPAFFAQIAAKLAGIPIIINTIHGFAFSEDAPFFKKHFFILIEKIAAKCSDLIFSISKKIIKESIKYNICQPDLIKYLGDGINISKFDPSRFSENFILSKKEKLGIKPHQKIIGIVARLVEEKGYLDLFLSFKTVLTKFPGALLLVIGPKEPEKRDAIKPDIVKKYGIEKNVIFLGEKTDVDQIYALMDVSVLPSHREGLGIATLEASAMEKPVIATNIGGCPETIDNEKTGILVPLKNPKKLAEAIIYILSHKKEAEEMGKNGREKIKKEFDEEIIFQRLKNGYQELINKKL